MAAQLLGDRLDPRLREGRPFRVDTPGTYISASAATSARSERWYRSNSSVEKRPVRSCATRSSSLPTRVISVRP